MSFINVNDTDECSKHPFPSRFYLWSSLVSFTSSHCFLFLESVDASVKLSLTTALFAAHIHSRSDFISHLFLMTQTYSLILAFTALQLRQHLFCLSFTAVRDCNENINTALLPFILHFTLLRFACRVSIFLMAQTHKTVDHC